MIWDAWWEGGSGLGTHVHPWRIHVNVWQNQYSTVKQKILKIKNKEQKKKKIIINKNTAKLLHTQKHKQNLNKVRQKRNMFQTKEQDKTPEKQLSEVHTGNLPEKGFQVKESKDDPRT